MNDENLGSGECTEVFTTPESIVEKTENAIESLDSLCRICGNRAEHLLSIYSDEGVTNDLADKMNLYLPIKVNKSDTLPLQCCYHCASTVLTWHELVIASVEADRRLREIQSDIEKQLAQQNCEPGPSQLEDEKIIESEEDRCTAPIKISISETKISDILNQNPIVTLNPTKSKTEKHLEIEEQLVTIEVDNESKMENERKTYQCAECGKCFLQKLSLVRHIRIHRDERPFTCHICGKGFRDASGLKRHIRDVHTKAKNFPCDLCSTSFASKATRDDHRRGHTKERPFTCSVCTKSFSRKASLYIHSKTHTNVFPFSCSVCDRKFRRRQELITHSSTHSGEKPYACAECGKLFRIKNLLTTHQLIHNDNKPFVCKLCGVAYRQSRYLKNHLNSKHCTETGVD